MATKKKDADDKGIKQCAAGTVLFREGDEGDRMYVIKSGYVRITKRVCDAVVTIEDLGPGEFCGEIALVNKQPRPVTATVLEDANLILIDADKFESMLKSNSDISLRMLKKMSQRLTQAQYRISNLVLRNNQARVLHQLREEVRQYAEIKGKSVHHPTPLPDNLADVLALEIGEVKEVLTQFVHDELISIDREGYFQILDSAAFERYLRYLELGDRFDFRKRN